MGETCHACEERPIRPAGEFVSWLEAVAARRLYCQQCADECAAGLWDDLDDE
jgi:hypothetical protein